MKIPIQRRGDIESFNTPVRPLNDGLRLVAHVEGRTKLLVPAESLTKDPPPTSPVFFNPSASVNRDVTISITSATEGETFCDSMCGVGARGVRVAKEVKRIKAVALVDFNEASIRAARRASVLNGVRRKCEFTLSETSSFLSSRFGRDQRFDFVDVDPFGTPARQLQPSVSATADGGIISVTATDTAVLCGVYPEVSKRRYGSLSLNNRFHHETGVRILFSALAREAAKLDAGIRPVAAHSTRHYIRVYAKLEIGAAKADQSLDALGFVIWCKYCGHCTTSEDPGHSCDSCGMKVKVAGPLWLGAVSDNRVTSPAAGVAEKNGFVQASKVLESLLGEDRFPPWSFSIEDVCSDLKIASVPEGDVYRALAASGHKAMRTPFEKLGVKTDASRAEFMEAVRSCVQKVRPTSRGRPAQGES
jgi:tRNA (guanine26-N2/guanine27-N2)-dimethyltransferase